MPETTLSDVVARDSPFARIEQGDVRGRASHIERDDAAESRALGDILRAEDATGGAGQDRSNRLARRRPPPKECLRSTA